MPRGTQRGFASCRFNHLREPPAFKYFKTVDIFDDVLDLTRIDASYILSTYTRAAARCFARKRVAVAGPIYQSVRIPFPSARLYSTPRKLKLRGS